MGVDFGPLGVDFGHIIVDVRLGHVGVDFGALGFDFSHEGEFRLLDFNFRHPGFDL